MNKIQKLPSHVADLIAAGEVVERPASVVKELVENAIDAGATQITVEIKNGGMAMIRVTDNGCGMSPEDAETAFLRHATSKIRRAEDLEHIRTLGIRGEALAATAAVSRVELLTKTPDAPLGVSLSLEAGLVTRKDEAGCPNGTTIIVRDLFFNTPARMKFMKRDSVEASAVLAALQHQALAEPKVAFRYLRDGVEELSTPGDGELFTAVNAVYSRAFAKDMVSVEGKWEDCRVNGFVTSPTNTRGNRNYQQFFVNGRYVKSRLLSAALEEAYRNQMMVGRFPGCVLMLTLPEQQVDVNVHPAKTEVKFLSEQTVFDCVRYGVQGALRKAPARPEVHFVAQKSPENSPKNPGFRTMTPEEFKVFQAAVKESPKMEVPKKVVEDVFAPRPNTPKYEPLLREEVQLPQKVSRPATPVTQEQLSMPLPAEKVTIPEPAEKVQLPREAPYRVVGEVLNSYIILEQGSEVLFMDKHAAHERILFEKWQNLPGKIMSQNLLDPITANLRPEECAAVLENRSFFEDCGFQLEEFGESCILLRGLPADMAPEDAEAVLAQAAEELLEGRLPKAQRRDELLHSVACKAAIKAGWHTNPRELELLVKEVMGRDDLKYCPHGRPICIRLTDRELEKFFKRT